MLDFTKPLTYLPFLLEGLAFTFQISLIGMVGGTVIGLLTAVARLSPNRLFHWIATAYLDVFRSTPLLVQFLWFYYALPIVSGLSLHPLVAASLVMSLYSGSFHAETFRAGIASISSGQSDAAHALGMTRLVAFWRIILPQAVLRMLPAYASTLVTLVKDSALASAISVPELLHQGVVVSTFTMRPTETLTIVALIYFSVTFPISMGVNYLHRYLRAG